jgi:hypothetical protein
MHIASQVELHTLSRVDKGRSSNSEALSHEVWRGALGSDFGDRITARKTYSAAEWADTALARAAVLGR